MATGGGAKGTVEWIPLNGEVRGVRVSADVSGLLEREGADARPCGGLLDLYVACSREYNIELCDDEKFLYRKCMRDFLQERRRKAGGAGSGAGDGGASSSD